MPRKKDDGVEVLMALSKAHPSCGLWTALVLTLFAICFTWIAPHSFMNLGWLFGLFCWLFAVIIFLSAFVGVIAQSTRKQRFRSQLSPQHLRDLSWQQFEQLVADLYRAKGYRVREVGGQNDNGVDLILTDAQGITIGVQCKRWKSWNVGSPRIREFVGALAGIRSPHGIFVTSGKYSAPAITTARQHGIELIDGETLIRMIGSVHGGALKMPPPRLSPIAIGSSNQNALVPEDLLCPKCGNVMVRRTAKRGKHVGEDFWGCSTWPRCRGTRPMRA